MRGENKKQKIISRLNKKGPGVLPEDTYAPKIDDTSMSPGNLIDNPEGEQEREIYILKSDRLIDPQNKSV